MVRPLQVKARPPLARMKVPTVLTPRSEDADELGLLATDALTVSL